ncbi:hypothetical protein AB835_13765 [Candidatus Endobugula sertula]|uniref:Fatty acid desaturase domain-containing protein n=1 Tax=Candidatus Endobugula sertula TaxID=62101 RepID=A0A1D2QLR2_9GAMM|nr:hypothetical protein AB835_13765 [Candidatus Endobugula sertula]
MFRKDVRESFAVKNKLLNTIFSLISGKPTGNEYRFSINNPMFVVLFNIVVLISLVLCIVVLGNIDSLFKYLLYLYVSVLICGVFRVFQVTHMHHCIHGSFFKSNKINNLYADIISGLIFVQNRKAYKKDHIAHHKRKFFTTENDSDARALIYLGFLPGKSKRFYYIKVLLAIFSPIFHGKFLNTRLKGVFVGSLIITKILACFSALTITLFATLDFELTFFAVILPLFILYNYSALLQFLTEHLWLTRDSAPVNLDEYLVRCWGRFCGIEKRPGFIGTTLWLLHLLFAAIPFRFGCLVSDLPAHDWHHVCGYLKHNPASWNEGVYLRQGAIDNGDKLGLAQREIWGLLDALDRVFSGLESSTIGASEECQSCDQLLSEV